MVDELFDRSYQSGRAVLNDGIGRGLARAGRAVMVAFAALNRVQFAAPWANQTARRDVGCA